MTNNPCDYVELPRHERYEPAFYSAEQLQKLFDVMKDDPMLPLVKITALYGLRRSEVLGLKWDSVDFDNNCLLIRHTVCKMMTRIEKDKTKTQSSRRSFPLTPKPAASSSPLKQRRKKTASNLAAPIKRMTTSSNGRTVHRLNRTM